MGNDASTNRTGPLAVARSWPGVTVPVAALTRTVGTPALQAHITSDTVTVTTDGTYNFGGAPEVTLFWSAEGIAAGQVLDTSVMHIAGSGAVTYNQNNEPFSIFSVSEMPGGKAWRIGSLGTDLNASSSSSLSPQIIHGHSDSTKFFESRVTFWPLSGQQVHKTANDAGNISPTWQIKPIWNTSNENTGGAGVNFFLQDQYFLSGASTGSVASNSLGSTDIFGPGTNHYFPAGTKIPVTGTTPPLVTGYPYAEPYMIEAAWDQGSADHTIFDAGLDVAVASQTMDAAYHHVFTGMRLSANLPPNIVINGFKYPGYFHGYTQGAGAGVYETDLYRAIGPNCKARVGLADGPDWYAAKKRCLMLPQSWSTTSITLKRRNGYWDLDQAGQCYLCVIGADGTQIGSVQL